MLIVEVYVVVVVADMPLLAARDDDERVKGKRVEEWHDLRYVDGSSQFG